MCDSCGCDGKSQTMSSMPMFGVDSMNTLGAEVEEGMAHEMSEPRGPMGEDLD